MHSELKRYYIRRQTLHHCQTCLRMVLRTLDAKTYRKSQHQQRRNYQYLIQFPALTPHHQRICATMKADK